MRPFAALLLLSLSLVASACGPVQSSAVISDAEAAVEKARTAEAPKYALYNFTLAELLLHKAREEAGYADFETAVKLAEKAIENAELASQKTARAIHERGPGTPPAGSPTPVEPQ